MERKGDAKSIWHYLELKGASCSKVGRQREISVFYGLKPSLDQSIFEFDKTFDNGWKRLELDIDIDSGIAQYLLIIRDYFDTDCFRNNHMMMLSVEGNLVVFRAKGTLLVAAPVKFGSRLGTR